MDSVHDLGGKQGFGPIPVQAGDAPFSHDWERRMWGIARAGVAQGITIDWFRHGLERMVPGDYLTFSYFQKWVTNYLMLLADNGTLTLEEIASGHATSPSLPAEARDIDGVLAANRGGHISFAVDEFAGPVFHVGDRVRTRRDGLDGHDRLAAYARNRVGKVIRHHGAHLRPDEGALGHHLGAHLYTVSFDARELWGGSANPRDSVTLEIWENDLVQA